MRDPTLIPEAGTYGLAIAMVLGLATFALAMHVQSRWLAPWKRFPFHAVHIVTMIVVCGWSALIFELGPLLRPRAPWWFVVILGLGFGLASTRLDRRIVRRLSRARSRSRSQRERNREQRKQRQNQRASAFGGANVRLMPDKVRPISSTGGGAKAEAETGAKAKADEPGRFAAWIEAHREHQLSSALILVAIALLEELIFRGFLLSGCRLIEQPILEHLAIVATCAAFALAHIRFGWAQVASKIPLSILATAAAMISGGVVAAMIVHAVFNFEVWQESKGILTRVYD